MPSLQENQREFVPANPQPEAACLAIEHRRILDQVLRHQNVDLTVLSGMLSDLNPEQAEFYLDQILEIDPNASDTKKTKAMLRLIKKHSPHTLRHSKGVRSIVEKLATHQDDPAFRPVRLSWLARAIERHDFGKLGMRDSTLNRSHTQFNAQENREKEGHPLLGLLIMKFLRFQDPLSERIALTHHLKYQTDKEGATEIVGYPKEDFAEYCEKKGLRTELTAEDQIASFADAYSALTDLSRPSNRFGTNDPALSKSERTARALDTMDKELFHDDFYQKGEGKPLFEAFKRAILETDGHRLKLAA